MTTKQKDRTRSWVYSTSDEQEVYIRDVAKRHTDGNKSLLIRKAVELYDKTLNKKK